MIITSQGEFETIEFNNQDISRLVGVLMDLGHEFKTQVEYTDKLCKSWIKYLQETQPEELKELRIEFTIINGIQHYKEVSVPNHLKGKFDYWMTNVFRVVNAELIEKGAYDLTQEFHEFINTEKGRDIVLGILAIEEEAQLPVKPIES